MSKKDVIARINSAFVQNNNKAINADSLRNGFLDVVDIIPEVGDGALTMLMPDILVLGLAIDNGEFTPQLWEDFKALYGEMEEFKSYLEFAEPLVKKSFEHNAKLYQTLMERAQENKPFFILMDYSYSITSQAYFEENVEVHAGSMATLAAGVVMDMTIEGVRDTEVVINELASELMGFPEATLMLQPDGSFCIMPADTAEEMTIHFPADGYQLTDEQKEENKKCGSYAQDPNDLGSVKIHHSEYNSDNFQGVFVNWSKYSIGNGPSIWDMVFLFDNTWYKASVDCSTGDATLTRIGGIGNE